MSNNKEITYEMFLVPGNWDVHVEVTSMHLLKIKMCNTGSDFDRRNTSMSLHQESIAKSIQTHSKPKQIYFLRKPSVALNSSFFFQPITMDKFHVVKYEV